MTKLLMNLLLLMKTLCSVYEISNEKFTSSTKNIWQNKALNNFKVQFFQQSFSFILYKNEEIALNYSNNWKRRYQSCEML